MKNASLSAKSSSSLLFWSAFLKNKWKKETAETGFGPWIVPAAAQYRDDNLGAPADYIIMWLAAWVREFGIDGFRCDTAKHVEVDRWGDLKVACLKALEEWRADETRSPNSPAKKWDEKFWTTGEAFGLTLMLNSPYKPPDISDEMLIVFENDFQVFVPNFIGTKLKIIPTTKTILIITDKRIAVFLLNFFIA